MKRGLLASICLMRVFFMLLLCFCVSQGYSQKYVKHKVKYPHSIKWWEVKYKDGTVGISIDKKKNIIVDGSRGYTAVEYDNYSDLFKVKKGDYEGYLDRSCNEILPPDKYCKVDFNSVYINDKEFEYYIVSRKEGDIIKKGVLDYSCNEIIPCGEYCYIDKRQEKVYVGGKSIDFVYFCITKKTDDKYYRQLCDTAGNCFFSWRECTSVFVCFSDKPTGTDLKPNIIGFKLANNDMWGACDKNGKIILPVSYEYTDMCDTHGKLLVRFQKDKKYGVAGANGKAIISPKYDKLYVRESDGVKYFSVENNGKKGICNATGTEIIPPLYTETIFYSIDGYKTKIGNDYVKIDISQFANPAKKIITKNGRKVLSHKGKVFSVRGYDALKWDAKAGVYVGTYKGYKTNIDRLGKEENSIAGQMFKKAEAATDKSLKEKVALYNKVIEADSDNKEGYKALALNNIGVYYRRSGDTNTALKYYEKAAALGNRTASQNISAIKNEQARVERVENKQQIGNAIMQFANALAGISSGGYGSPAISNDVKQLFSYEGKVRQGQRDGNGRIIDVEMNVHNALSSTHYIFYKDGYCHSTSLTSCVTCNGRRVCYICNGQGRYYHAYFKNYQPCPTCYGKGVCPACGGKGMNVSTKL